MTEIQTGKINAQLLTKCINHWADSASFKGVTLNKHCSGLTGKCFEMPNASYTNRCVQLIKNEMTEKINKLLILIGLILFISCEDENLDKNYSVKIDFYASDTIIGINESVLFSELSEGNPTSWYWEFEGGSPATSTDQFPKIVYDSHGVFDVKLIAKNNNSSDTITKRNYIIVEELTHVNFELSWQKSIGENNESESIFSFIKTSDGGYMSSGTIHISNENTDVWIVKYDQSFNVVWEKIYSGNFHERGSCLIETSDGNFLISGSTNSTGGQIKSHNGYYDIFLLKIDSSGDVIWQKSYGGSNYEGCDKNSLKELSNGNLLISGYSDSNNGDVSNNIGDMDLWLININSNGTLTWEKTFGGSLGEYGRQVIINNGELIVGLKSSSNDGDFLSEGNIVTKISLNGEIIWVTNLGGMNYGKTIIDRNGGYISLIGNSENSSDLEIIKISETGSILWKSSFGGSRQEFGEDLIQLDDNSLIVLGISGSDDGEILNNYGSDDIIVAKISISGKLLGLKNFGGSDREWANCLMENGYGEYVINASTTSIDNDVTTNPYNYSNGPLDNWLINVKEIIKE